MERSIGGDTQSTNTGSFFQDAISTYISSTIDDLDEKQKRQQRIREQVTKQERERCLSYKNN